MNYSKIHLSLRKVGYNDENLLFNWSNDPKTRKWSFNKNSILLEHHKVWFKEKLNDPNVLMWILEYDKRYAGLIRLQKDNDEVVLNYLIAPEERGKNLASKMLVMAMNEVRNHWHDIEVLAYTFPENFASIKSLEKAGFYLKSSNDEKNCYVFKNA